jgi:hypothetical protein
VSDSTEDRLLDQLAAHATDVHPEYELVREMFEHRMMSPVEPCHLCGRKVFLLLPQGRTKPTWLQLGDIKGGDTLFPKCKTKRHQCGDGESWSVEAALFVESALVEWGVKP